MNNYEFWEKYNKFIKGEIGRLCRTKKELYIDLHIHSNYSADGKQNLKQILETTKDNINELIDNIEKGTVDSELLPELNKLMELLKRG